VRQFIERHIDGCMRVIRHAFHTAVDERLQDRKLVGRSLLATLKDVNDPPTKRERIGVWLRRGVHAAKSKPGHPRPDILLFMATSLPVSVQPAVTGRRIAKLRRYVEGNLREQAGAQPDWQY
jgi:hypothetical protein